MAAVLCPPAPLLCVTGETPSASLEESGGSLPLHKEGSELDGLVSDSVVDDPPTLACRGHEDCGTLGDACCCHVSPDATAPGQCFPQQFALEPSAGGFAPGAAARGAAARVPAATGAAAAGNGTSCAFECARRACQFAGQESGFGTCECVASCGSPNGDCLAMGPQVCGAHGVCCCALPPSLGTFELHCPACRDGCAGGKANGTVAAGSCVGDLPAEPRDQVCQGLVS
eukprot:jgi/Mesvir1/2148/Mv16667-RA.1